VAVLPVDRRVGVGVAAVVGAAFECDGVNDKRRLGVTWPPAPALADDAPFVVVAIDPPQPAACIRHRETSVSVACAINNFDGFDISKHYCATFQTMTSLIDVTDRKFGSKFLITVRKEKQRKEAAVGEQQRSVREYKRRSKNENEETGDK
jgi:hypothetical protein